MTADDHFTRLAALLELESEAEARQVTEMATRLSPEQAEAGGTCLTGLAVRDGVPGLGGRFLVALANPKTLAFYGAFFPQFISADLPVGPQLAILCVSFVAIGVGWMMRGDGKKEEKKDNPIAETKDTKGTDEPTGPRILLNEDFTEPFEQRLGIPKRWSEGNGFRVVKGEGEQVYLELGPQSVLRFVKLPPDLALGDDFAIDVSHHRATRAPREGIIGIEGSQRRNRRRIRGGSLERLLRVPMKHIAQRIRFDKPARIACDDRVLQ